MTAPLAPPQRPQVSYLPGSWLAIVADDVLLLAEMPAAGLLAGACWDRISQGGGVDGVLGVIAQEGLRAVPNFALVGPSGDGGTRLVVSGKAQAEVSNPGQAEPATISAAESTTWQEQRLAGRPAIRLVTGTSDIEATTALPLLGGVVSASALAAGVSATGGVAATAPVAPASIAPAPVTPAGPREQPVSNDTMPPRSDFDSGLIDSLPWRKPETFLGESAPPASEPPPTPVEPEPAQAGWDEPGWQSGQAPWPDGGHNPWGDPGGQAPWAAPAQPAWPQVDPAWPQAPQQPPQSPGVQDQPAPPDAQGPPAWPAVGQPAWPQPPQQPGAMQQPANPWAPGGSVDNPEIQSGLDDPSDDQVVPVVHAVACPRRHLNPPYATSCRVCDEPIASQEPFSAPRPTLGVLKLSTGDTVPLDRDVVLGRAPFHADDNPASRPHLVQLASPGNDISRSHVRVSLENWFVQVTDLGSTNGTVVTLPGQAPVRLRPHDPFTILPGTSVNIADEITVRFEVPS